MLLTRDLFPHPQTKHLPIIIFLFLCFILGLTTFRDYGLSWDEPLFYDYGRASEYAFSVNARLDGTFDIEKSFGASAGDHVTRGPAYLILGGILEGLLERTGLDLASAWHLTNFITYLVGLIFFYKLSLIWLGPIPATLSTAFFATQPVLWNHAFINPKDSPFAAFFIVTMYLGFRMVEQWETDSKRILAPSILPGILLGVTSAIRFFGFFAAILIFLYYLSKTNKHSSWWGFLSYSTSAIVTMVVLWPFLWTDPLQQFIFVLKSASTASPSLKSLFWGNEYHAYELPRRYLPTIMAITLTEPTWLLFLVGIVSTFINSWRNKVSFIKSAVILLWFGIVIVLLVVINPPNWDGYRHYLFILPPVFLFCGVGVYELTKKIRNTNIRYGLSLFFLLPAIISNINLHPYEYAYYNVFVGGEEMAFRKFETDYWLTCYKEAMEIFNNEHESLNTIIYVKREAYIAAYYADSNIKVRDYRGEFNFAQSGDYLLINTRTNEDTRILRDVPPAIEVGRSGAIYCVIKKIP